MTCAARSFDRRNTLTYAALGLGIAAVAAARAGDPAGCGALLALAVLADTFDGRFARRFGNDPDRCAFGAELDSLSDAVTFGAVPLACSALLSPAGLDPYWWAAAFVYAACAITRLGFYNLSAADTPGFVGLPVPVAALAWSSGLWLGAGQRTSAVILFVCAAAMVSPLRIPRPTGIRLAAFLIWPAVLIAAHGIRWLAPR